jgi:hypothetical protein
VAVLAKAAGGGKHSGGCGAQCAYLRGPGEAGDTGWRRRLVLCKDGSSCRVAAEMDDVGEEATGARTLLTITTCTEKLSRLVGSFSGASSWELLR